MLPITLSNRWLQLAAESAAALAPPAAWWLAGSGGDGRTEFAVAYILSSLLLGGFGHPHRVFGLVPPAYAAWVVAAVYGVATGDWPGWLLGLPIGVISGAAARRGWTGQDDPRGWRGLVPVVLLFGGFLLTLRPAPPWLGWAFLGLTATLAAACWYLLFRPFFELACEPVLWLMYSVRGTGPGLKAVPARGPCLVVANHACWADPFLLAKVLPRPITPVMTSAFYDLPVISWLMRRVIKAIRVPERPLKQDVPQEIREVIAALDRGECVVLFPEGYLRRSEERPLRRFGRGVWQVLTARPETPVFPCWIEGGWGSYTSYQNGPPTKNKRPDFRRRITLAVDAPVTLGPDELARHLATRIGLMNRVAAARKWLGLPELPPFSLPSKDEDEAMERG